MDPLKRNNPGVRATNHEDRIQALERRFILPTVFGRWQGSGSETLADNTTRWAGYDYGDSNDPTTFSHMPATGPMLDSGPTTEGAAVILRSGWYRILADMILNGFDSLVDGQRIQSFVSSGSTIPGSNIMTVGSHDGIQSKIIKGNQTQSVQNVWNHIVLSVAEFQVPLYLKQQVFLTTGNDIDISSAKMVIAKMADLGEVVITDEGIPVEEETE